MDDKGMRQMVFHLRLAQIGMAALAAFLAYKAATTDEGVWGVGMYSFFAICFLYGAYKFHGYIANFLYMVEIGFHLAPTREEKIGLLQRKLNEVGLTPKQRAHLERTLGML